MLTRSGTYISDVNKLLSELVTVRGNRSYLSGAEFARVASRLNRVARTSAYSREEKAHTMAILAELAKSDLARRRTETGGRQMSDLSYALINLWSSLPAPDDDRIPSKYETGVLASALGLGVYTLCADELAFQRHREIELDYNSRVTSRIRAAEKQYLKLLEHTHVAAKSGNRAVLRETTESLALFTQTKLFALAQRVGMSATPTTVSHSVSAAEIRTASLIRRTAMLAGACIHLDRRLMHSRLRGTTIKLAKRRNILSRGFADIYGANRTLQGVIDRQVVELTTRIDKVNFLRRGTKPYASAQTSFDGIELRVPYKSLWQNGVSAGPIWCRARLKKPENFIEMEFEGPGQHANQVWEDWLSVLARETFDINPGSLHIEQAIPLLRTRACGLDIMNRIPPVD